MTQSFDILTIGNAIVDILCKTDDSFITGQGLVKGSMTLIDEQQADTLYEKMGPTIEASGGSAGNTAAGLASLGSKVAYIGKVANDTLGKVFTHDIRAIGAHFQTPPLVDELSTARSMVLISPDGERTMSTWLGACTRLCPDDIDTPIVENSGITYVEGYLWDKPDAKAAILKAIEIARKAGKKFSLSLSDPFCVDRHRQDFLDLLDGSVDILFANEQEICHLYGVASFAEAVEKVRGRVEVAALTRGAAGSVAVTAGQTIPVPAAAVPAVVDTTGAGDLYAAGFLHGLVGGRPLAECALIGGICAAECISHVGPRPQVSLAGFVTQRLGNTA
ncbi:adenosine kinase [Haematospirillum sp. H1815]|uniref:adenosine kinase n=1 Tax=Haematospirillum sp. H1815 TaxID=2723108 RepID=UPI00143AFD0F|nr:adenosine kinase [Haematospirillum sp. H1815]NKD77990.1 adenosine kinase [Haematospirillum sp. H1815]